MKDKSKKTTLTLKAVGNKKTRKKEISKQDTKSKYNFHVCMHRDPDDPPLMTKEKVEKIVEMKQLRKVLDDKIDSFIKDGADGRLCALAKTQLEIATMCVTKAISKIEDIED